MRCATRRLESKQSIFILMPLFLWVNNLCFSFIFLFVILFLFLLCVICGMWWSNKCIFFLSFFIITHTDIKDIYAIVQPSSNSNRNGIFKFPSIREKELSRNVYIFDWGSCQSSCLFPFCSSVLKSKNGEKDKRGSHKDPCRGPHLPS